jgi:hypothetical protein
MFLLDPSALKRNALNQLSYAPFVFGSANIGGEVLPDKIYFMEIPEQKKVGFSLLHHA